MKRLLQPLTFFLFILIGLSSCKSTKESIAQRKADIEQSKESTSTCFVQMNDGSIINYTTLKLVTGVLKTPHLLANGKIRIMAKDIKAYQNEDHYAISQESFVSGRKTYVSSQTLPGFAIRIAKGKINVYAKKYFNGSTAVDEYFVQKGENGVILAYTSENMNELVKDDDDALSFFLNKKYNTSKTQKDQATVSYANNGKISIKNK